MTKPKKLTMAQVYTLRRMKNGIKYVLNGDERRAHELRPDGRYSSRPVNAPSIPVLFRLGLIEFNKHYPKEKGRYYNINLTELGRQAILDNAGRSE